MKLKIYIIKKQQLMWAALILAIVIISAILIVSLGTKQTFKTFDSQNTISADVNNDGKDDSIVIRADDKTAKYSVDIIFSDGKGCTLESDPTIKSLGYYKDWWRMNVNVKDVNKDGISEVILQASDNTGPILHVFRYNNGTMERVTSGRYPIFGTLKSSSDKAGIMMLGSKKGTDISYTFLRTTAGKLIPYTAPTSLNLGKDTLSSLVSYIEKNEVEAVNINMDSKYSEKILKGSFLDCSLFEAKYTKYDVPSECVYIIRTAVASNEEKLPVVYKIRMLLTKYDSKTPEYRITSVDILDNAK